MNKEPKTALTLMEDENFIYFQDNQANYIHFSKDFGSDSVAFLYDEAKALALFIIDALKDIEDIEVENALRDLEKL